MKRKLSRIPPHEIDLSTYENMHFEMKSYPQKTKKTNRGVAKARSDDNVNNLLDELIARTRIYLFYALQANLSKEEARSVRWTREHTRSAHSLQSRFFIGRHREGSP